jgi:chemotaxis protein MotB
MADENEGQGGAPGGGPSGGGQVIVVKKKNKHGEHPHHGGAWKVAYADFVTAMMAFFLLLWLLSNTTKEQKMGIAHYFNPPNNSTQMGGGDGIMGGNSVVASEGHAPTETPVVPPSADVKDDIATQASEDAMFKQVAEDLKKQVMNVPELRAMAQNMLVDLTPEGLRITITDSGDRPLFENGSARMFDYTQRMVALVASTLAGLPNDIAVGGHTDSVPYRGADLAYTNWELSADRAQAARRIMVKEGIPMRRMARVAGYAGQQPLLADHPEDQRNRRITMIVLRGRQNAVAKFSQSGFLMGNSDKQDIPAEKF